MDLNELPGWVIVYGLIFFFVSYGPKWSMSIPRYAADLGLVGRLLLSAGIVIVMVLGRWVASLQGH